MRKSLTPEQAAARDARLEKLRELATQIAALSEAQRDALAARMAVRTIEGRILSGHNQCMVALQCPSATIVGGRHLRVVFACWPQD